MGRSKATVPFCGRPLICRMVERLSPVADELIITTNEPENLVCLHTQYPNLHIQLVCDAVEERGALPGLYTALRAARNPYVAVVACDMVFASPALVVAEALQMTKSRADVVVPEQARVRAVHAVYRRMGCLRPRSRRSTGATSARRFFFDQVNVCEFPQEKVLAAEPMGGCFINANTPAELAALEGRRLGRDRRLKGGPAPHRGARPRRHQETKASGGAYAEHRRYHRSGRRA
ncbi:MAG: molybdenum cofactor guanylyltransferase [Senegalimassilia faecalis]